MNQLLKKCTFAIATVAIGTFGAGSPIAAGPLPYSAGIVAKDGTIRAGHFFTVVHTGTGQYTITYNSAMFGSIPAMTVTAFGGPVAIPVVYAEKTQNHMTQFFVVISSTTGTPTYVDSAFQFTIVVT